MIPKIPRLKIAKPNMLLVNMNTRSSPIEIVSPRSAANHSNI